MDLEKIWHQVLAELEVELGKSQFRLHFQNSELISFEDGIAKISFPNKGIADQVNIRYYTLIQNSLQKISSIDKVSLVFEVKVKPQTKTEDTNPEELGPLFNSEREDQEEFIQAVKRNGLRSDFSLDEFCVSTSNQLAFAAAQAVIKDPGRNYNPFFIWGGVGIGKTHLMQAIGIEILRKNPRARIVYASCEQFTNEIIQGIRSKNTHDFKEKYRGADALLIDDIQFLSGKDTAQEEFFHTFNAIQQREGQIVMTSDTKPSDIKNLADRLKSRFEGGLVADISAPDSELKTAICLLKARKRGVELSTTVASSISSNVDNIRSLDGAIKLVISTASSENKEITPEFVSEVLKIPLEQGSAGRQTLDARTILDEVCNYYGLSIKLIKGDKRDRPIAEPRQILMYLLRKQTKMTLDEVAAFLGGRDHSTIIHGEDKIEALVETNDRIKKDVSAIELRLGVTN